MSNQDRPRYSYDERLTEAQRDQYDAAADALQNRGSGGIGSGVGGAGGAAGAVAVPLIILGSFFVFMLYACFYPVGAIVALVTGVIVSKVFDTLVPNVGWMMHYLVMLPLAFSALMIFQQRVEPRFVDKRGYRLARHVLRLVFTAVITGLSLSFFTHMDELRDRLPVEETYSLTHLAIVVAAVVLVHFVGLWQDRRLVAELEQTPMTGSAQSWAPAATARPRFQVPGLELAPAPLRRGLPVMSVVGGLFGAFLGYAGFETTLSTLVGLFAGCIGGALLMFTCWLVTRPVGGLFDRVPMLWPVLMGAIVGFVIAWRLALADNASLAAYALPGVIGGAVALTAPYLVYVVLRRMMGGGARSVAG